MGEPGPSDRELVESLVVLRAQTGEADAFRTLFHHYNDRLLYYLCGRMRSRSQAEDVLQEVWLTVVRKVATLEQPTAFKGWLYRVAYNHAMSRLRKARREPSFEARALDDGIEVSVPVEDDAAPFAGYDAASIHAGLGRLSSAHREVLVLRFLDQLTYQEIAAVVDCTVGTIRSRIHYAKKSLRTHLLSAGDRPPKKEGRHV